MTESKYILPHKTKKMEATVDIKRALSIRYTIFCEWFGIDNCFISQIWFFGTFGLSTFMLVATYLIAGFLYGF
ncbi:hypothetical protein CON73_23905 [Bacillus toyonensis]|uniref:DUF3961 domain-containing protein n=1 Tax=Bacillus toyonensis TaxID=155322 RepID=A0A2B7VDX4_9BACI|nr:hypothetical protein CN579_31590 [Bacillus toyonensis]PGG85313.1 hypothetical protein CON73_23905 [Bacillus toyonensis]